METAARRHTKRDVKEGMIKVGEKGRESLNNKRQGDTTRVSKEGVKERGIRKECREDTTRVWGTQFLG